ncbi:vitelline membrane outer layer 1-like protein [Penaeus vannamei]|uniref:Vitelline membrane outer layer 1-like protein n=1 Tax=Penaeus vannamei TaxID=6689 RepID=A0A3R7PJR9_PENVA|nr:vitelline membrane outer layer 1-like protein [Penaeus vannamei]
MRISLLLSFFACCALVTAEPDEEPKRPSTSALGLSNGLTWGDWGPKEFCPDGSFVHAFDTKYETFSDTDETGLNAVKLFCSTPAHHDTGYVTSVIGQYGDWQGESILRGGGSPLGCFLNARRIFVVVICGLRFVINKYRK